MNQLLNNQKEKYPQDSKYQNESQNNFILQIEKNIEDGNLNEIKKIIDDFKKEKKNLDFKKIFLDFFVKHIKQQSHQTIDQLKNISNIVNEIKIDVDLKPFYISALLVNIGSASTGTIISIIALAKENNLDDILNSDIIKKAFMEKISWMLKDNQTNKAEELIDIIIKYNILNKKEIQTSFYTGISKALANNNLKKIADVLNLTKLNDLELYDFFTSQEFKNEMQNNSFLNNFLIINEKNDIRTLQGLINFINKAEIKNELGKCFNEKRQINF